ncbi:glycosyl hydrolase 115 family protein [Flammeovirga sp. EKP202]|uniref:glycosyl hydrolase 115 family protein n=1 Tax=Flammeovirga sp. EKP202 TaxID=2770592 RepID=UPI00165F57AE|nr:glycosyl hydrolase 115 family protein [Flammeovirga sp. EKP202]MBD0403015.1 glycosyl hydrolase 115 family protein [Flammeovirga sp. EKP202]
MAKILNAFIGVMLLMVLSIDSVGQTTFQLFEGGKVAEIYVSENAAPQILRAVKDLQNDIEMVTGLHPKVIHSLKNAGEQVIIIGTTEDKNIQQLQKKKQLQEASKMKQMRESFLLKPLIYSKVKKNALVVVGSDALGAVYGIYELSERIGVSPLYWWCDVIPKKKDKVILKDVLVLPHEPSVKFRGIFINDEEALTQWSENTSKDKLHGNPSPEVYQRVFELLLRLKANTIWPGMMKRSSYFFEAKDKNGQPINPMNAKEYGIYVGTSHCENMARNNYDEWEDWAEAHANMYDAKGVPVWDYTVNPKTIEAYWQERLEESKEYNMIYTLGIRGVHDSPFLYENLENPTLENKVKLLQTVINRQRQMIKETFGSEDAVPQVFVPYEETGELYNGESRDGKEKCEGVKIPEDVMMVWTEDNFGYARQLPRPHEQQRKGGNGIYYHIAYQGYPTTYDWLYTTSLPLMQEELRKVYDANARAFWIVNVGDIKPAEIGAQFFMELAYDIESYPRNTTKSFLQKSAQQQFGMDKMQVEEVAELITNFHNLCRSKRPEAMTPFWDWTYSNNWMYQYYSAFDFGDEAQRQIHWAGELEEKAKAIYESLDENYKAPFWHLAYYPIRSTHLMLQKIEYYRKNIAYAKQGRFGSVNVYKFLSEQAEADIQADLKYYNEQLKDGKWNGIMDPYALYNFKERVFDVANIPNNLVYDERFLEEAKTEIGAVCEGQVTGKEDVTLRFSSFEDNQRFIDIFNKGFLPLDWEIQSDVDWIKLTKSSGTLEVEERIFVTIDWNYLPSGDHQAKLSVKGKDGEVTSFPIKATKYDFKLREDTYVEGNGIVAIEAENYTALKNGNGTWEKYQGFGFSGSSMFVKGGEKVTDDLKDKAARLEYSVYFSSTGTFYGQLYRIPTLNEGKGKTCEIAIGLDDNEPQVLNGIRHKGQKITTTMADGTKETLTWHRNVLLQMEKMPFKIKVDQPGYHTLKIYQVDNGIGIDRVVICTDQQAEVIQKRSLLGSPESYNSSSDFSSSNLVSAPKISYKNAQVLAYPKPEPLTEVSLNFAMYAMIEAHGFAPVNQRHIFNENTNQWGWDKEDVQHVGFSHNESSERVPFWQRDGLKGKKEAKFYIKLKKGTYDVTFYMGDARIKEEMIYNKGVDYKMSFSINDQLLMDNEEVYTGKQKIKTVEVEVNEEELLTLTLSGKWMINALIVKPKKAH